MFPVSCKLEADFCSTSIVLIKLLPRGCFFLRGLAQRTQPEWSHWTQHLLNAWWLLTEGMSCNRTWLHSCYAPGYKWKKRIEWFDTLSLVCRELHRIVISRARWFAYLASLETCWPHRTIKVPKAGYSCDMVVCGCSSIPILGTLILSFSLFLVVFYSSIPWY